MNSKWCAVIVAAHEIACMGDDGETMRIDRLGITPNDDLHAALSAVMAPYVAWGVGSFVIVDVSDPARKQSERIIPELLPTWANVKVQFVSPATAWTAFLQDSPVYRGSSLERLGQPYTLLQVCELTGCVSVASRTVGMTNNVQAEIADIGSWNWANNGEMPEAVAEMMTYIYNKTSAFSEPTAICFTSRTELFANLLAEQFGIMLETAQLENLFDTDSPTCGTVLYSDLGLTTGALRIAQRNVQIQSV